MKTDEKIYIVEYTKRYQMTLDAKNGNDAIIKTKEAEGEDVIILDVKYKPTRKAKAVKFFNYKEFDYKIIIEFNEMHGSDYFVNYTITVKFSNDELKNRTFYIITNSNQHLYYELNLAKTTAKKIINDNLKTQTEISTLNEAIRSEWNLL